MGVEFLKADAVFHDELSRFLPDVAVMPRLVPSGEQHLARRVALYKAVLRAVLVKPIIEIVVHVFIDKLLIVPVIDIDREAELMLAAAGEHGDLLRFLDSELILRLVIVRGDAHFHRYLRGLAVKELVLIGVH